MRKKGAAVGIGLAAVTCLALAWSARGREAAHISVRRAAAQIDPQAIALRIQLGRNDTTSTRWDGSIHVMSGTLARLDGWRFHDGDRIVDRTTWKAATHPAIAAYTRYGEPDMQAGTRTVPNGVVAVLRADAQTEVEVRTPAGTFRFQPGTLPRGQAVPFLNGAVSVEKAPADYQVTFNATENDFPTAAPDADGNIWIAYVAYTYGGTDQDGNPAPYLRNFTQEPADFSFLSPTGNGDQIILALLTPDGTFSDVAALTDPGADVLRPAVVTDGQGSVWTVWSENKNNSWHLFGRKLQNGALSDIQQITSQPGPDLDPVMAADDQGNLYLAWQGFRKGNGDIFLKTLPAGADSWPAATRTITTSLQNEWAPAIATAHDGSVYIAWDTYVNGNYDVRMRRLQNGQLSNVRVIAGSTMFEARPSLACDAQNRLWVAYEQGPVNWGKDFGYFINSNPPGNRLYVNHTVVTKTYENMQVVGTPPISNSFPSGNAQKSFPRLGADRYGNIYATWRQQAMAERYTIGTTWYSWVTVFDGNNWVPASRITDSDAVGDNRPSLTAGAGDSVFLVYSSDGRSHLQGTDPQYQIYTAQIGGSFLQDRGRAGRGLRAAGVQPQAPDESPSAAAENDDIARMRAYRLTAGGTTYQLLRGDFHRHTEISTDGGGDGPLVDMYRYAMDAAGQDWICAGDHQNGALGVTGAGREYTWWIHQKLNDAYHVRGKFTPIFGYERSIGYPNGHRNIMFPMRGVRPCPTLPNPAQNMNDTKLLYRYLAQFGGITAAHTCATDQGTDWRDNDPNLEPIVEIYQGDRLSYEDEEGPRHNVPGGPAGYRPLGFVRRALLEKGLRFGFQSSSDHISTHISYAVAIATDNSREAIFDAFKKRHTYGATDNILLDVRSGKNLMGDAFTVSQAPSLNIHAVGTGAIARVVIVKNGDVVASFTPNAQNFDLNWTDMNPAVGTSYYYVRIEQQDTQIAWGSPMWITYQP